MFRSSSRCSIRLCADQNGRYINVIENSKVRMSRYLGYVYQSTKGQNHGPVWKIKTFFSKKRICTVTLGQDFCKKGNLTKFHWKKIDKKFKLECSFVNRAKGFFIFVCGRYQNDRQKRKHGTNLENSYERL